MTGVLVPLVYLAVGFALLVALMMTGHVRVDDPDEWPFCGRSNGHIAS